MATQRAPITFPPPPPNETADQRKERVAKEREEYFKDLIERKYPELQDKKKNAEVRNRATANAADDSKDKVHLTPLDAQPDDPRILELNRDAQAMTKGQLVYYVQMAHKARSPKANVPWVRFIGCETTESARNKISWGKYLEMELHAEPTQCLTIVQIARMQPFMVCLDERQQFDAGTDKRIKRLLGMYQQEFDEQRTKFQQHRKSGLTEDEHKTRSSFFAKETAWREAKKRHDATALPEPRSSEQLATMHQDVLDAVHLRNHTFPSALKQERYNFVVVSYFRDTLAFQRCFHDLSLSTDQADFQPIQTKIDTSALHLDEIRKLMSDDAEFNRRIQKFDRLTRILDIIALAPPTENPPPAHSARAPTHDTRQ